MQNEVCRLQTRGKMKEKTAGNTSALVEVHRNPLKSGENVCIVFRVLRGKFVYQLRCRIVFPPMILWNTLFIEEFCFNSKP